MKDEEIILLEDEIKPSLSFLDKLALIKVLIKGGELKVLTKKFVTERIKKLLDDM